ncbi:MAG: DUF4328 domain-containing protein [Acidimicrobiales bacterium]
MSSDYAVFSSPPPANDPSAGRAMGPPPIPVMTPGSGGRVEPLDGRANATRVTVWISTGLAVLGVATGIYYAQTVAGYRDGSVDLDGLIGVENLHRGTAIVSLAMLFVSGITTMMWLHRLTSNTEALRPGEGDHEAKWAILGWIVPFLNFVRPQQMIKQAWSLTRPRDRNTAAAPRIVRSWWAAFLAASLLPRLAIAGGQQPALDDVIFSTYVVVVSNMALVAAGVLFVSVVSRLTARHNDLIQEIYTAGAPPASVWPLAVPAPPAPAGF